MSSKTEIIIDGKNNGAILAINGVKQGLTQLGSTVGGPFASSMKSLSGYLSFAAVGAGIGALASLTKKAIDTADEIYMMSQKIGISVESLSVLQYAAEQSDLSLEQLQVGIKKLSTNLYDVAHGQGKDAALAFNELGVSALDMNGKAKESNQILLELADKFAVMSDGTEKSALAVKLFGKAGLELIPFLNQGSAGINDLTREAEELGLKLDTETGEAAERFNDSLNKLNRSIDGMVNQSLPGLLDFFTGVIEGFHEMNEAAEDSADWMDFWSNMYVNAVIQGSKDAADSHREAMAEAVQIAKTDALDKIKGMGLDGVRSLVTQTQNIIKSISSGAPYADQQNDIAQLTAQLSVYTDKLKPAKDGTDKLKVAMYDAFGHPIDADGNLTNIIKYIEALQKAQTMGGMEDIITNIPTYDMSQYISIAPDPFDNIRFSAVEFFDMYDERASMMRQNTSDMFGNMSSAASMFYQASGQKAKAWFQVHKAFSIAQGIINTYEGATKALAQGGFFGIAMAAAVIAAGLAQVAMIASQNPSTSGGAGNASSGYSGNTGSGSRDFTSGGGNYNQGQSINYNIIVNGSIVDHSKFAREIVPYFNNAVADGAS